jgi:hypothetical protein
MVTAFLLIASFVLGMLWLAAALGNKPLHK